MTMIVDVVNMTYFFYNQGTPNNPKLCVTLIQQKAHLLFVN